MRNIMLAFLIFISLISGGCWDAVDVNDLYIPFVAGYDFLQDQGKDKYSLAINFPVLSREAKEKSDILVVEGETPAETRIDRGNKSSRNLAIGDLRVVLLGDRMARQKTKNAFDMLFREPRFSELIRLAVTEGNARDILQIKPQNYQTVGQNIIELLNNAPRGNFVPVEDIHEYQEDILTDGFNPVLPVIGLHDKDRLDISGAALFKKDRMIAKVGLAEMKQLVWLRGEKSYGDILFEIADREGTTHKITFEGQNRRSIKAKLVNGKPVFDVNITLNGVIVESLDDLRFAGEEDKVMLVGTALEEEVKQQCENFLTDLQNKYQVDAILLGKYARAKWPPLVKNQDWDKVFCNSEVRINVKVNIQGTGEVA